MLRITELKLPIDHPQDKLLEAAAKRLGISPQKIGQLTVFRRGYDARKKSDIQLVYTLDLTLEDEKDLLGQFAGDPRISPTPDTRYLPVAKAPDRLPSRPIIIGTGPCGIMAGLVLAQMGFRPIILERGKIVRERTRDTWGLWRQGVLNPDSNVQFGEGGAGTFSDGKLYSQIKDTRFHGRKVLEEFVKAGAPEEILYVSKPHIGTFRLVSMIEKIRATILELGGEIHFESRVSDLLVKTSDTGQRTVEGIQISDGSRLLSNHVILAIGHSARDTFAMLHERGVYIEPKPFSIGVRIEHPQTLIDQARFGKFSGHPLLGAADYKLVHHCKNGRSVYSFCMCPGGQVVAATSEPGMVVTNGMSQYSRAERNANSGIVVEVTPEQDFPGHPLAGIEFQRRWESRAFEAGGSRYTAPAQRVGDFLQGRPTQAPGQIEPSYQPGVHWTDLSRCLPDFVASALREAIPAFARQIRGFDMADAVMTGVETRTSSPVRIKRNRNLESINTQGLYPAGEGAGYAGGILSAGVDGIKVAEAVALSITRQAAEEAA